MKIAICDDEMYYRERIKDVVVTYLNEKNIFPEITQFCSGIEFCEDEMNLMQYDIIFLDIDMKRMNGMDVAREIRKRNCEMEIVFITAVADYVFEGYKVNASRYIMKREFEQLLPECLDCLLKNWLLYQNKIRLNFISGYEEIDLKDLLYIESNLRKLCFVTTKGILYQHKKLDDLEREWSELGFIRCHQSFLVNREHIINVRSYKIYLSDGTEIPIARARYPYVKERMLHIKKKPQKNTTHKM